MNNKKVKTCRTELISTRNVFVENNVPLRERMLDTRTPLTIEEFVNNVYHDIERISSGASVLDAPIPDKKLVDEFKTTLSNLVNICEECSKYYTNESENVEKLVGDLQHLSVFAKLALEDDKPIEEYLGGDKSLPAELKDVPLEKYGDVLVTALYKRRQLKDTSIMFKITAERLSQMTRFIQGMDTRTYALRSKQQEG